MALHDFLPDEKLREVDNLHDFAGMLVFDKWTCNTNGRQTVFFEPQSRNRGMRRGSGPGEGTESEGENKTHYHTVMIDQGFCFTAAEWNFPGAPLRGLYARNGVYAGVTGMDSFGPWLERLEKRVTDRGVYRRDRHPPDRGK